VITVAGAHDQQLVPCYAASVFMSFQQIGITLVLLMIVLITVMVAVSSSIATWRRFSSPSTSRPSPPTARPTARSADLPPSSCGYG
jgi:hypothetical protein